MGDEIDAAPQALRFGENAVEGGGLGDVAMAEHGRVELGGQGLDPPLEGVALIGQGQFGAVGAGRLGDAPGDGAVVGDAEDEPALAGEEAGPRRLVRAHRPQPPICPNGRGRRIRHEVT